LGGLKQDADQIPHRGGKIPSGGDRTKHGVRVQKKNVARKRKAIPGRQEEHDPTPVAERLYAKTELNDGN